LIKLFTYLKGDRVIWMIAFILAAVSLLSVYSSISSLAYKHYDGNTLHYLFKHGTMLLAGIVIIYYVHRIKYKYFSRLSQLAIWISAFILVYTLLFGSNVNDASRWIRIPIIGQSFQPSDFAKIALITFVARILAHKQDVIHSFKEGVLPVLIPIIVICGLILPANFSTAVLLFGVCLVLMFVGRVQIKHLALVVGGGLAGFSLLLLIAGTMPEVLPRLDTWKNRIVNWQNPDDEANYQIDHAMMAIEAGGVLPNGPGHGDSRNYLPHPYSDMIYAFIIEEYGSILGGIGVMLLYLILLFRAVRIAISCQKTFGALLVIGLTFSIVFQALVNMAVAVNLVPVTGQPMPLVSMGGTSTWLTCLAIGMILSVSRGMEEEDKEDTKPKTKPVKKSDYAIA
jgi:cell division protein FtsW